VLPNRLKDGQKLMKAIRAESTNTQSKINFREGSDQYSHGSKIVSHPDERPCVADPGRCPLLAKPSMSPPDTPLR
jgi:hypothetical protein